MNLAAVIGREIICGRIHIHTRCVDRLNGQILIVDEAGVTWFFAKAARMNRETDEESPGISMLFLPMWEKAFLKIPSLYIFSHCVG